MMKIVIGLCDDEKHIHEKVKKLVKEHAGEAGIVYEMIHFYSAKELLASKDELDVLLLDIDMPEMDGIEAAHCLKKRGISYKIIMLTAMEKRYKEAFKINAFRFVTKPIVETEFYEALDEASKRKPGMEHEKVYADGIAREVMQRDMMYLMADRDVSLIFTKSAEYQSEVSLRKWMERLDGSLFFQCHKSYIVNLDKITSFQKNIVILESGEKVPVSRRKRIELENAYMEYDTKIRG